MIQNGEFHFGFKDFIKTVRFGRLQTKNKINKNVK